MSQKIILCCIVKDDSEAELFERMLKSFMPHMAGLAVAITGLTPEIHKLKKIINQYNGHYIVTSPESHPEIYLKDDKGYYFAHFGEARNVSFKLAKEKYEFDWYCWADTDDMLKNGADLQQIAEQAKGLDMVQMTYWYSVQQDKTGKIKQIVVEHVRERLLSTRIEWKWISRLHEVCVPIDGNYQASGMRAEYSPQKTKVATVWVHLPPENHFEPNLLRNVKILEVQMKEEQRKDPRTLFYLAKCYIDLYDRNNDKSYLISAKELLNEYLKLSGWAEERSFALQYIGMVCLKQEKYNEALQAYHQAIIEHPISHLPYLWLANIYMQQGRDEEANHWLDVAIKLPPPTSRATMGTPLEIRILASKLLFNQSMKQQNLPEAIKYKKLWNQLADQEDDGVLKEIEGIKETNDAALWLVNYSKYLRNHGHKDQLKSLMSAMAPEFRKEDFAQQLIHDMIEPKTWDKGIVYLCASQFAQFDPRTAMKDGIGGSETATMRLSEEWAKKGHKVTVFGNVTADCEVNGVTYIHWNQFNIKDKFDTLIIWRNPGVLDNVIKANKILLDLHDVSSNLEFTPERLKKIDKVMVKSAYHRKNIPNVPDEKVMILGNGIDA